MRNVIWNYLGFISLVILANCNIGIVVVSGPKPVPPKEPKIYSPVTAVSAPTNSPLLWGYWALTSDYTQDCTGSEATPSLCTHLAEKMSYALPKEVTSCSGLTAEDALGVFNWSCEERSQRVYFNMTGLKSGKGLRDLIDFNSSTFKANRVVISGYYDPDAPTAEINSLESVWYSNPITTLSANMGSSVQSLSGYAQGTVLVISSSMITGGFSIDQSNLLITMPKNVTLNWSGNYAGPFFYSSGYNFNWIEVGTLNTASPSTKASYGLDFINQKFLTVMDASVRSATTAGMHFKAIKNSQLGRYTGSDPDLVALSTVNCARGIFLEHDRATDSLSLNNETKYNTIGTLEVSGSTNNSSTGAITIEGNYLTLNNVLSYNNAGVGVQMDVVGNSTMGRIKTFNNGSIGFRPRAFSKNKIKSIESVSNTSSAWSVMGHGFSGNTIQEYFVSINSEAISLVCAPGIDTNYGCGGYYNIFNNVTLINTKNNGYFATISGIDTSSSSLNIFSNVFISNVGTGLSTHNVGGSTTNSYINTGIYNADYGLQYMNSGYSLHLSGLFMLGSINTQKCTQTLETYSPNCTQSGTDGSTNFKTNGLSDATFRIDPTFSNSNVFVGEIGGVSFGSTITQWIPSTSFQYWLKNGTLFSAATYGQCGSSDLCQLVDIRFKHDSSAILNKSFSGTSANSIVPSAQGLNSFTGGGTCPDEVSGNQYGTTNPFTYSTSGTYPTWFTQGDFYEVLGDGNGNEDGTCNSGERCQNYFLRNAREIVGDSIGDDDGLCESSEACVYSPNLGAYQGHGTLNTCTYVQTNDSKAIRNVTIYGYSNNGI
jgi:hypothetical protein